MKDIKESLSSVTSITEYLNEKYAEQQRIDEGLKELLKTVKDKFQKAWEYLKGVVIKAGSYFLPVDDNGEVMPAISPLTAGQAYKDGLIKTGNTCVVLDKVGAKIVGLGTKFSDALGIYGPGDSRDYWVRAVHENEENKDQNIVNEVKLQNNDPQARYNVIVDDAALRNRIERALSNKKLAKLMVWGAPGIGKSAILLNILKTMEKKFPGYQLITKTLSNETPDNFTLPTYVETAGGKKADDVPKTWLPVYKPSGDPAMDAKLDEACGNGLLFIDELSRATPQVLNVILPLVNEGIFNGYKLGSGWTIICASNRRDDEKGGQSEIGNALANRFAQVYYEPTVKTWRKWADQQQFMSPLILQWLSLPESENMSGAKFYYYDPNEDYDGDDETKLMCTPRSWTNAMMDLADYDHTGSLEGFKLFDIPRDVLASTLNEYIPADAIDSLLAFLDVVQSIGNFDQVVRDVWQNGGKNLKIDKRNLNKVALPLAQLVCTAHNDKLPTGKEFENLADWVVAQNSDQLASYILDIFKHVYANEVSEGSRDTIYVFAHKLMNGDDTVKAIFRTTFAKMMKKWGVTDENLADYNYVVGLRKLSTKYGASFSSAIVDGVKDALG